MMLTFTARITQKLLDVPMRRCSALPLRAPTVPRAHGPGTRVAFGARNSMMAGEAFLMPVRRALGD